MLNRTQERIGLHENALAIASADGSSMAVHQDPRRRNRLRHVCLMMMRPRLQLQPACRTNAFRKGANYDVKALHLHQLCPPG